MDGFFVYECVLFEEFDVLVFLVLVLDDGFVFFFGYFVEVCLMVVLFFVDVFLFDEGVEVWVELIVIYFFDVFVDYFFNFLFGWVFCVGDYV